MMAVRMLFMAHVTSAIYVLTMTAVGNASKKVTILAACHV